jgi:hypothetical protein
MTPDTLLTASDKDLPRLLGEVLINEDKTHEPNLPGHMCKRCFISFRWPTSPAKDADCPAKNLIPLTPDNAFKWRDWAIDGSHYMNGIWDKACDAVYYHFRDGSFEPRGRWFVAYAQPKHYLIAAALCVLKGKDNE